MPYPPLSLIKRLPLGHKMTPAQMDQNLTDIETAVNAQLAQLTAELNPDGTLKNNSVATAAIVDRAVTLNKLAFLSSFYAVDSGAANAMVITWGALPLAAYAAGLVFYVKAAATNTGATTLKVDALAPASVQRFVGTTISPLSAGDIVASNVYILVYDGAEFLLLNPTQQISTGPQLITPALIYPSAGAVAWTTSVDVTGLGVPAAAKHVILQCTSRWASATDGAAVVSVRANVLGFVYILNRVGGTDAVANGCQGMAPLDPATHKFDYQMTETVGGAADTEITLIGYYL